MARRSGLGRVGVVAAGGLVGLALIGAVLARGAFGQSAGADGGASDGGASDGGGGDGAAVPDCSSLPNPLVVIGSSAFEPTLSRFAVKLAALAANPMTVIYQMPSSCTAADTIANNRDLTGGGHTYTANGAAIVTSTCRFPASGQKADLAISDAFYDSCADISPPALPSTIRDVPGPVRPAVFVIPNLVVVLPTYITALEAQDLYGCGAKYPSNTSNWTDELANFCFDPSTGAQIVLGQSLGVPASKMTCNPTVGTAGMLNALTLYPTPTMAIGFLWEDAYDQHRDPLRALAFQAVGQRYAYYPDRDQNSIDRSNVRDGHYFLWGYEHMLLPVDGSGAAKNQRGSDFIGYVNGTKTDASLDYVAIEGSTGVIPTCAMKVRRSADGGPLAPASVADPCACAFEAAATSATPSQCQPCHGAGQSTCSADMACHHGFCE